MAPWSEFGWEVTGDDCFDERPLEFSGRRSTEGEEETFVQKLLNMEDGDLDETFSYTFLAFKNGGHDEKTWLSVQVLFGFVKSCEF